MPLPLLHSFAGYKLYQSVNGKEKFTMQHPSEINWQMMTSIVILSNLADLDYVPGVLLGNANLFHHGPSHSLLAGVLVGLLIAMTGWVRKNIPFWKTFRASSLVYLSHVILDFFSCSHSVPLLWPISNFRYGSTKMLFPAAGMSTLHANDISEFADSVHSYGCLRRLMYEGMIIMIFYCGSVIVKSLSEHFPRKTAAVLSGSFTVFGLWFYAKTIGVL